MARYTWSVTQYIGRSARIRLVDNSTDGQWGHINFDDVQFDWEIEGSPSGLSSSIGSSVTSEAGAAYAFRLKEVRSLEPCLFRGNVFLTCEWEQQQRFQANDKRAGDKFGYSVAISTVKEISDSSSLGYGGVIIVGAPFHDRLSRNDGLPLPTKNNVGAIYCFKRLPELRDGLQKLIREPKWLQQTALIYAVDNAARAGFGFSVSVDGYSASIGAPYDSDEFNLAGATYYLDVEFLDVKFSSQRYQTLENAFIT